MEAPPLVDLTEEPKGWLRAKVAHVAKRTLREEVRRMKDQKRSITAVPTTTTTTTSMPRQVLVDFDHPLVRFMRQVVRTDTSTTTTAHEVPHHHHTYRHKEHKRRARYLRHLARDERHTDDRLAQYRAYFRLEEAERIGAGGETSCPCNRVAVLEQLRLCLLYTSPSPRDKRQSRMPSSA